MRKTIIRYGSLLSIVIPTLFFATQSSAAIYWPFNTPYCLQSQVLPWNTLPGTTLGDTSFGIKLANQCKVPLSIVEMDPTQPWIIKTIHPIALQATDGETLNGIGGSSTWNTPFNQISSRTDFTNIAGTFQLYAAGALVPRSPAITPPWVTGDAYHMTADVKSYWGAVQLNVGDWFALNIATSNPGNVSVTLAGTVPQVVTGNVTFNQSLTDLNLPAKAKVYIDLDFSNTAFSYLGVYRWDVLAHPTLQLPVSVNAAGNIQLPYTVEGAQTPTGPHGFTWQRYVPAAATKSGTLSLDTNADAKFSTLAPFSVSATAIKLQGIIGMPFKEGGAMDGTGDDLSKLNPKLTGTVVAFANLQLDGTIDVEPMHKTAAQIAAFQQNYEQFQNNQHVLFISFGGEAGGAGAEHIVTWGLAQLGLDSTQSCAISPTASNPQNLASCDSILQNATGPKGQKLQDVINESAAFYETLISRYKPDGVDLDIEGDDVTQLGSVLTALVVKKVIADVQPENPNFILGLTVGAFQDAFSHLQYNVFQAFADKGITPTYINGMYMALPLSNWAVLPHCQHFTVMPATPDGACLLDTINAYKGFYAQYWGANNHIIPGITPMTLHDPSSTVEIWPTNDSGHVDQLGVGTLDHPGMLSAIQTAQANKTLGPVLFAFWDTRNDFNGGFPEKSYTPNQYQNELADYSSSAFVDMSISWPQPNLAASATSLTTGAATWSENATDTIPGANLTYTVAIDNGGVVQAQSAGTAQFNKLAQNTTYNVTVTVTDDKGSPAVARRVQFKTTGAATPQISWSDPQLVAAATGQTTGGATWSEKATDTTGSAKLSYTASINNGGVVQNQSAGHATFTGLTADTTYTVTVKVSDDQGALPVTRTTTFKTSGTGPTPTPTPPEPGMLAAPISYTWSPKAGGVGEFTFAPATGGTAPYTYVLNVTPTADPQKQSDTVYWIYKMVYYKPYTVSITVTDASGATATSKAFTVYDTN